MSFVHCEIFVQTAQLFCVRIFLSQISQAFEHLLKSNKPLTTSHLQKTPHFLRANNRPKAALLPAKNITMTRQKSSFRRVKAWLWQHKSAALTSEKAKNDHTQA